MSDRLILLPYRGSTNPADFPWADIVVSANATDGELREAAWKFTREHSGPHRIYTDLRDDPRIKIVKEIADGWPDFNICLPDDAEKMNRQLDAVRDAISPGWQEQMEG